ncbi:MAG: hypothetical protein FJW39_33275 [Acidobacteria bacterium]|nr:hypothetical protein [Acidobacteriota bacterium]
MRTLLGLITFALISLGADINGNWKATSEGPNGQMERTFAFKVDGSKLTGETTSSVVGKSTIEDGKVDGDNLSFKIKATLNGNDFEVQYKGKVTGTSIELTADIGGTGQKLHWKGNKVQ